MTEPDELRAELARAATVHEPPLILDTDRLVAAGKARRLRRQAVVSAAGALAAAVVIGVPVIVFAGPGIGLTGQSAGAGGPTIPVTPGAPHGGCAGQTRSGSTQGYVLAQWLQAQLPGRQHYRTMAGWQVSYLTDCVDGAHLDTTEADFRVSEHAGDLQVVLGRDTPRQPLPRPCTATGGATVVDRNGNAVPAGTTGTPPPPTGTPTSGAPANGAGAAHASAAHASGSNANSGGKAGTPPPASADGGRFTRCETRPLPGGVKLTIEERQEPGDTASGGLFVSRTVRLWRPDGTTVTAVADNRLVESGQHPAASAPLTVDEMTALVQNPGLSVYLPPAR